MRTSCIEQIGKISTVLLLTLLLASCGSGEKGAEPGNEDQQRTISVTATKAVTREVQMELYSVGRMVSMNMPQLAAEVDARVVEVRVNDGQAVSKGQVLVLLDKTTFELARQEAQAAITQLSVSIANEERRVSRYRDLKTKEMMPQERLDDAEAKLATDRAALAAAEARFAIAQDRLSKAELVSPVDGMVEKRHVSVGDFVSAGRALVAVTDTVNLKAEMPFPETVGHLVKAGQKIHLQSPIAPGVVLEAEVSQIRPQVGSVNRSLIAIVNFVNPGPWRPEATVEATLVVETRPNAVVVPASSVVKRPAGDVLYVTDYPASRQVREVVVKTGVRKDDWVEVRQGLEPGMTVVVEGAHYLSDGASITIPEASE